MKLFEIEYNDRPEIIIMVGLPGAGKSTYINTHYPTYTLVSSDAYIEAKATEMGSTYSNIFQDTISAATANMYQTFERAVENNDNIVWDQTNLSAFKRKKIIDRVPSNYKIVAVVFDLPDELRQQRMSGRVGKEIPDHIIDGMKKSFTMPSKEEGFDDIVVVKS
jgi:predicted kinase